MTYVDAWRVRDEIWVTERRPDGSHAAVKHQAPYELYYEDPKGQHVAMDGTKVTQLKFSTASNRDQKRQELRGAFRRTYESDVRTEFRLLEQKYRGAPVPKLHVAIVDIEVDSDPNVGWAGFEHPYAPINAITVYQKWNDRAITLALKPPGMTVEEAEVAVAGLEDVYVLETEREILEVLLSDDPDLGLLYDADIFTGWNSFKFDLPYIIARIRMVLGGETLEQVMARETTQSGKVLPVAPSALSQKWLQRLCGFHRTPGAPKCIPRATEVEHYGSKEIAFDFFGKKELDYLRLYQKFTFTEQHSYKLDHILQVEIGQNKVAYEGTLYDLYRKDFRLFCEYNRQDVMGLAAMDRKLGFIDLANEMAHMACVNLPETLGSVNIIEQAILLELHARGFVSSDKPEVREDAEQGPVAGAFVHEPTGGMYDWVASYDVNSLYPSVIRMLNISPECLYGQFEHTATESRIAAMVTSGEAKTRNDAWGRLTGCLEYHSIVDGGGDHFTEVTLDVEGGSPVRKTGAEWNAWFKSRPDLCLTANGTVFRLDKEGILAACLSKWYNERKQDQAKSKDFTKQAEVLRAKASFQAPDGL
jgi:DNA polymerase elongation subunit (family B)